MLTNVAVTRKSERVFLAEPLQNLCRKAEQHWKSAIRNNCFTLLSPPSSPRLPPLLAFPLLLAIILSSPPPSHRLFPPPSSSPLLFRPSPPHPQSSTTGGRRVGRRWDEQGVGKAPSEAKSNVLSRCQERVKPWGLWLEFGVYHGATLNMTARHLKDLGYPDHPVFGFDSFLGSYMCVRFQKPFRNPCPQSQ